MSLGDLGKFQPALERMQGTESWKQVKKDEGITGTDLCKNVAAFAKTFTAQPLLAHFNTAHSFTRAAPRIEAGIAERLDGLVGSGKLGIDVPLRGLPKQKQVEIAALQEARGLVDAGLAYLHPDAWSQDTLPPIKITSTDHTLTAGDIAQIGRDFNGRGVSFLWQPESGKWLQLPQSEEAVKEALTAQGAGANLPTAMAAATQTTLNALATPLIEQGKTVRGVEYQSYFVVTDGEIKVRIEGKAQVVNMGQKEGPAMPLSAFYDSSVSGDTVHVRV